VKNLVICYQTAYDKYLLTHLKEFEVKVVKKNKLHQRNAVTNYNQILTKNKLCKTLARPLL
jgi:hypothetical protein